MFYICQAYWCVAWVVGGALLWGHSDLQIGPGRGSDAAHPLRAGIVALRLLISQCSGVSMKLKNATEHLSPSWRLSDAPDRGPPIFWLFLQFFCGFFDVLVEITTKPHHPGCGLRCNWNVGLEGMPRAAAKAVCFVWAPVTGRDPQNKSKFRKIHFFFLLVAPPGLGASGYGNLNTPRCLIVLSGFQDPSGAT